MSSLEKSIEAKRDDFRKIVERSGILDLMVKALVELYKAKFDDPKQAMEFFQRHLSLSADKDLVMANARILELEAKISILEGEHKSAF